jgi:hypothetical protein
MDERTTEILNRFNNSWAETTRRYDELIESHSGFERLKPVRQFIETLKQNGDDKFFRLGTSVHDLIISRSVEHGLRTDQKYIKVEVYDRKYQVTFRDGDKVYREYMVESLDDVRISKLLKTLKDTIAD